MANKYRNLQQLILFQKQYKLLQSSIKYTKELMYNNKKIIVYTPPTKDIIAYDSKINLFTFHQEKI